MKREKNEKINFLTVFRAKDEAGQSFKIFDMGSLLKDKTQGLTFFLMLFAAIRLMNYSVNGCLNGFKFKGWHKWLGIVVYFVFIVLFVILEFVVYRKQ